MDDRRLNLVVPGREVGSLASEARRGASEVDSARGRKGRSREEYVSQSNAIEYAVGWLRDGLSGLTECAFCSAVFSRALVRADG